MPFNSICFELSSIFLIHNSRTYLPNCWSCGSDSFISIIQTTTAPESLLRSKNKRIFFCNCNVVLYLCFVLLCTIIKGRKKRKSDNKSELQEITLVSTLAISPVNLEDTGLYTCQSGFNSEANVTVIVISGKQMLFKLIENGLKIILNLHVEIFLCKCF